MADVARCTCPKSSDGTKCGRNPSCAIHGDNPKDPAKPYVLSAPDRQLLHSFRIAITDSDAIQQVRQADEDRFKP